MNKFNKNVRNIGEIIEYSKEIFTKETEKELNEAIEKLKIQFN